MKYTESDSGSIVMEPGPGIHIGRAVADAIAMADRTKRPVEFLFNGQTVTVAPGDLVGDVCLRWQKANDDAAAQWRSSPDGMAWEAERLAGVAEAQDTIDRLLSILPADASHDASLMVWLEDFIPASDTSGVKYDRPAVARTLSDAGWISNDCVGMEADEISGNPRLMARYVVGQAMDFLERDSPIWPGLTSMIEKYRESK